MLNSHIIVVDDDREIRDEVSAYLEQNGFRISQARDGVGLRRSLTLNNFDLVLLDLILPGEDGLSLCRYIREQFDVPIIILSGRNDEFDQVLGLEVGADDYITKPFKPNDLIARIRAVIRRSERMPLQHRSVAETEEICFDEWRLDVRERRLTSVDGQSHFLSTAQFNVLTTFLQHPNVTLSRNQILDIAYSRSAYVFDRSIDNVVCRLRKILEDDRQRPKRIVTVWGQGYIFYMGSEKPADPAREDLCGSDAA